MKYFISPHNDDETLFGAFTIQREDPTLIVVFDSVRQPARGFPRTEWRLRRLETIAAMQELGLATSKIVFLGLKEDDTSVTPEVIASKIETVIGANFIHRIWLPAWEDLGNVDHNRVAMARRPGWPVTEYLTYGQLGKSTDGEAVEVMDSRWVRRKLRALACYESQLDIAPLGCWPHFMRDQTEYYTAKEGR